MCGIAGIVSRCGARVNARRLQAMTDCLAHRGPDDAGYAFLRPGHSSQGRGGYWTAFGDPAFPHTTPHLPTLGGEYSRDELSRRDHWVGLGHRRLSILDLSHRGHQPMATPDQRLWITHNGEVYNFKELRRGLTAQGYDFVTETDTEVLLHLWEEAGNACLEQIDGMFAFALYDRQLNDLILARDRFGVKPLYYAVTKDFVVFGSEIKALFASGLVPATISPGGLVQYFTFQNVLSAETIWQGVHLLPAGCWLHFRPGEGGVPTVKSFHPGFSPGAEPGVEIDHAEHAERVADAFRRAVERQLVSDVPVGSYLSGGMDSGSIVAVAGRQIPRLHTFTAGFDLTNVNGIEQGFDERRLAEQLSFLLQTEHYDVVLHAGDMPAAMEQIAWHMDDPRVGMCHQNWYVAKLASKFVKVCLAGTGGDELFAGYPWRYRACIGAASEDAFAQQLFRYWHRLLPPEEMPGLFHPDLRDQLERPREAFLEVLDGCRGHAATGSELERRLDTVLRFEFKTFLNGLLVTDDRISMAHGLESRVPFLDNSLSELAWSLPAAAKISRASLSKSGPLHLDSAEGKKVLRQAMQEFLPAEFLHQRKQGFSPPDANWYRGPSVDYIRCILSDEQSRSRPWFDQRRVEALLEEHFQGKRNHRLLIWSLLSFEWAQRHFGSASPEDAPVAIETSANLLAT